MGKDKRGISRGSCTTCECDEFESEGVRCDYCGHPPVMHLALEPMTKKARRGNPMEHEVEGSENFGHEGNVVVNSEESSGSLGQEDRDVVIHDFEGGERPGPNAAFSEPGTSAGNISDHLIKLLQKQVDELTTEDEGVGSERRFVISKSGNKIVAFCNACTKTIAAGEIKQRLNFVKQHMDSQTHKMNVEIAHSRSGEIPIGIIKLHREIENDYPRTFIMQKEIITCRSCQTDLSLLHKAALLNVKQHVSSLQHRQKCLKKGASECKDISSFFSRPSKDN